MVKTPGLEGRLGAPKCATRSLLPLTRTFNVPAFAIVVRDVQADNYGAAQPRAVQQRQDGRVAMDGLFRSSPSQAANSALTSPAATPARAADASRTAVGVAVAQLRPVKRPGVAATVAQQAGKSTLSCAHSAFPSLAMPDERSRSSVSSPATVSSNQVMTAQQRVTSAVP
jgi:hypothetical protein